jgi:hypothetical protein
VDIPTLNEPAVQAVIARLETNLTDALTVVNSRNDDGYEIEKPVQILPFIPPPDWLNDFPTIGIGDGASGFEDDTGFAATGRHELLIVIYLQHADQDALAWQLRRYTQAVAGVVLAGRNLEAEGAWGTGLVRISPGPTLGDNEEPEAVKTWVSWAAVQIWAKHEEY